MKSLSISDLWGRVQSTLDKNLPVWRERVQRFGQVQAIKNRSAGKNWSDDEIQEALVKAVLSNNTDWSKIERVLPELNQLFHDYSLSFYAALNESAIDDEFVPWFKARKAASVTLRKDLKNLIKTSSKLHNWSQSRGSAEDYFVSLYRQFENDPKKVALEIGSPESKYKLPAFGVPLAAEALRNMGFDLAKPDRHILRAIGSFGLMHFAKWPDQSANKAPQASQAELLSTMKVLENFAVSQNQYTAHVDNAIWFLCAKSGLAFSNTDLRQLAGQ